jgi:hypothetical protein
VEVAVEDRLSFFEEVALRLEAHARAESGLKERVEEEPSVDVLGGVVRTHAHVMLRCPHQVEVVHGSSLSLKGISAHWHSG